MHIEIIVPINDLTREVYRFYIISERSINAVLDSYFFEQRQSTRHKFVATKRYNRLDRRGTNMEYPVIPDIVRAKVREKIVENIKISWEIER